MTDTANLGLPFIEASQAQKHVTHNEALRILDAAVQIAVLDLTRTAPPSSPADGERHVVASGATGAWAGQANAIATWQDGAWAFLAPKSGWCIWSVADAVMVVFDGTLWRDLRSLALDNAAHIGVNTMASAPNLLSVKSDAVLFAAIDAADGGSGDVRLQLSKDTAAATASVVFSDAYSGRAEFGLVGSDAFKLKVSAEGSSWVEALSIDQGSGNVALAHGLALTGVVVAPPITADQDNYAPTGFASASVLHVSADAPRSLSGLVGGAEGRIVSLVNTGSQPIQLLDESAGSMAANRFMLGGDLVMAGKRAAVLRYDSTAARWLAIAGRVHAARAGHLQTLLAGSGTYTIPAGIARLRVRLIGGGGGGGGSGTSSGGGNGSAGGSTTFGGLTGGGGDGGIANGTVGGGLAGGGDINIRGSYGSTGNVVNGNNAGSPGGVGPWGGGSGYGTLNSVGNAAAANSGSGGSGGGGLDMIMPGGGGGAGGYVEANIAAPAAAYSYAVGVGGAAGSAGTSGFAGGAGGSGMIIIEEFYD